MSVEPTYGPTALLTPANLMTAFRLVVAPFFIYLIIFHRVSWWTSLVGLLAAASDYFDGIVARRHGTTTSGAFLDPLADKVIVLGGLYALVVSRPHGVK
ncbi:MAG: CDP-alcohol phosphatidyltransferase family protein, partial [Acidobacteriota bacterium]|nr:CDP-alcohol phosphatidyltransferase family protein [Acidobacteriota bacterium]